MTYRTITAVLSTAEDAEKVTRHAIALAERHGAHLVGVHAETPIVVTIAAPMEFPDPNAIMEQQAQAREVSQSIERTFRTLAQRSGVSHEWRLFTGSAGYSASGVIDSARGSDLVVAIQLDPSGDGPSRADIEDLLYESGRPLCLISDAVAGPEVPDRVLIAWNGTRESARAVFDALPLLKEAKEIEVFSVNPPEDATQSAGLSGSEIAGALTRHGLKVSLTSVKSGGDTVAHVINRRVSETGANLLVMGAFSHSWLRHRLFGGVTSAMMKELRVPAIMSR
ncbi:nucleotide-binding universal stress UspA family protein [Rhizobium azooxidifex]|uniref:Nucleotide-binding universal stress UspA family protein n=1 Tax=Mycoplana azooxidifex TaxID=1636188 RepID=A0A7W6DC68_9HYPH|nr:universal stress protein [Mycoplana azooxidifex]MBB3977937.1 nucleotide-binding universal stress UspA family protein [Mycoplana azooxidifex]